MTTRKTKDGKTVSLLGYGAMRLPTTDGGHANGWAPDGYSAAEIDQATLDAQVKTMLEHGEISLRPSCSKTGLCLPSSSL